MGFYTIKDLETLSGIKAHTLRIWEHRYKIIQPQRTATNIRTYSDEHLRKILNIALLNKMGLKISRISSMNEDELIGAVKKITEHQNDSEVQIDALIIAMMELNEEKFEQIFTSNTEKLGFEKNMLQVIYPFLQRVGNMWMTGAIRPANEHFISNLIRQKIVAAINSLDNSQQVSSISFLLFSPEGELHEIPLLFSNYLLKVRNFKTLYIGVNTPFEDVVSIYTKHQPPFILTTITRTLPPHALVLFVENLSHHFKNSKIYIAGSALSNFNLSLPKTVNIIDDVQHLLEEVAKIK